MKSLHYKEILAGTRFGKLTVGPFCGFNVKRNALFECRCDCGKTVQVSGSSLRLGTTKSCGCLAAERMSTLSASLAPDETGKQYGKLRVLRRSGEDKHGSFLYECECTCGERITARGSTLRSGITTFCGNWNCRPEMIEVMNEVQGPDHVVKNAYFAGHFDGEGCISFQRQAKGIFPGLTARVSNVFKPTILEYQEYFGGTIRSIVSRGHSHARLQWAWHLGAQHEILRFINRILPYSKEKKPQLELAKAYLMERISRGKYLADPGLKSRLPNLVQQMSDLKRYEFTN